MWSRFIIAFGSLDITGVTVTAVVDLKRRNIK
jgi:hypothetical protein